MIPLSPTLLLTLSLLAATVLGCGIGACLWHLRSAARFERAREAVRRRSSSERGALDAMLVRERESVTSKRAEAREVVARARVKLERMQVRHDSLARLARDQARRIAALEAEILVRGEPGSAHANRHSAIRRETARGVVERTDDDLPILNRRIGSLRAPAKGGSPGGDPRRSAHAGSEPSGEADALALATLDAHDSAPGRDD